MVIVASAGPSSVSSASSVRAARTLSPPLSFDQHGSPPPPPGGGPWRIGVLTNSVADRYLHEMAEFYKLRAGGETTIEVARRDSVVDAIRYNRTDAALVRVIAPITTGGDEGAQAAERLAVEFAREVFPALTQHLPS